MTPYADSQMMHRPNVFARTEAWMDARGKGAWIAAMVLGFVLFWPVGLALLAYMTWGKRMFRGGCGRAARFNPMAMRGTGNTAFDAYRADTLRRLEEEREAFEAFLHRLREAKDKAEFDQFMADRANTSKRDDGPVDA